MTLTPPPGRPPKSLHRQSQSHYHTISSSSNLKYNSFSHQSSSVFKDLINHPSSSSSHHHHDRHSHFLRLTSILSPSSSSSLSPQSHYRTQSSQSVHPSPNHPSPNLQLCPTHPQSQHFTDGFLSSTDEFASAEEGDESIWITGEQDEVELSSSYTSSSSNQSKPHPKSSQSAFLSIRESLGRPTLPIHWTSTPNINSNSIRSSRPILVRKSKSIPPTPISQEPDQPPLPNQILLTPTLLKQVQTPPEARRAQLRPPSELKKSCSKEDLSIQSNRSSKLISQHPVTKSLSRAFGSDFFNLKHHSSEDHPKPKPIRSRLPSSTSSYLSFKSFQTTHPSPQSSNEEDHQQTHRLSSVEMSKPMISLPFLTPSSSSLPLSHPRSHSSPGTLLTDQPPEEEHTLGITKRRYRQFTSDDKSSSRNSSTLYLKQLSNLFHPHSSHPHHPHPPRERLVSTISTQSIMTVQPTWKEEVAQEDYPSFLNVYGSMEMKRQEVIHELIETEKKYVFQISRLIELFYKSEETEHESIFKVLPDEIRMIFEELKKMMKVHEEEILKRLIKRQSRMKVKEKVAQDWLKVINRLRVYETYLIKFEMSIKSIEELKKLDSDHRYWIGLKRIEGLEREDHEVRSGEVFNGLSLMSFLLKPVQRLMKYPLFFKQLKDFTPPTHSDFQNTTILLEKMDEIIREMQDQKIQYESILKKRVMGKFEFKMDSNSNLNLSLNEDEDEENRNETNQSENRKNLRRNRSRSRSKAHHRRRRRVSLVSEFGSEEEKEGEEEEEEGEKGERLKDVEVIMFENEILIGVHVFKMIKFDERLISSGVIQVWLNRIRLNENHIHHHQKHQHHSGLMRPILFYIDPESMKERKRLKEFMKGLKKMKESNSNSKFDFEF
ncbi:hypothetical protein DFH28DRAFT_934789 [Melampsora americana]|nr:hypothetical protein DFH28DRAFT_934789 [Melampsora americana]